MARTSTRPRSSKAPARRGWWRSRPSDPQTLYLENLSLIERVAASSARRSGFSPEDVEDFVSLVHTKLIDDDYAVIRRHRGDSQLSTFLVTVVKNLFLDFRNHKWGKFRASAKAKKLGPLAIALETLLVRDQHDLASAVAILRQRDPEASSREALEQLAAQLPPRTRRVLVGEEALGDQVSAEQDPESSAGRAEQQAVGDRLRQAIGEALGALEPQDRLLMQLHFRDGETLANIATSLGLGQRPLYSRKNRCLRQLKQALVDRGLSWDVVRDHLDWTQGDVDLALVNGGDDGAPGYSAEGDPR